MTTIFRALRWKEWLKNILCFAGLFFSLQISDIPTVLRSTFCFIAFCCLSSAVYLFNDIRDREADRHHPRKAKRPIASGALSVPIAIAMAIVLGSTGLGIAACINGACLAVASIYLIQNVAYSFGLKNVVILDVMLVALGFVWRAVAGVEAAQVPLSPWLLVCTYSVSLFMVIAKRRNELQLLQASAENHRISLAGYSLPLVDAMTAVVTTCTVLSYALYTVAQDTIAKFETNRLVYTTPIVIYGVFRYLFLVHKQDEGGSPVDLFLKDRGLKLAVLAWMITVAAIIY